MQVEDVMMSPLPQSAAGEGTQHVPADVVRFMMNTLIKVSTAVETIQRDVATIVVKLEALQCEHAAMADALKIPVKKTHEVYVEKLKRGKMEDSVMETAKRMKTTPKNLTAESHHSPQISSLISDPDEKDLCQPHSNNTSHGESSKDTIDLTCVEVLDLQESTTAAISKPLPGPSHHLRRKVLVVFGGRDLQNKELDSCILYDPTLDRWAEYCNLPRSLSSAGVVLFQDTVYLFGGHDRSASRSEIYSMSLASGPPGEWQKMADLPEPVNGLGCAVLNGKIYLVGGFPDGRKCFVFDPVTRQVRDLPGLAANRALCGLVTHPPSNSLYSVRLDQEPQAERFNTDTERWYPVRIKGQPRCSSGYKLVASDDRSNQFCNVGGYNQSKPEILMIDSSNLNILICDKISTAIEKSRICPGGAILDGVLYVAGGRGRKGMERFDTQSKVWIRCADMPTGVRWGFDLLALPVPVSVLDQLDFQASS